MCEPAVFLFHIKRALSVLMQVLSTKMPYKYAAWTRGVFLTVQKAKFSKIKVAFRCHPAVSSPQIPFCKVPPSWSTYSVDPTVSVNMPGTLHISLSFGRQQHFFRGVCGKNQVKAMASETETAVCSLRKRAKPTGITNGVHWETGREGRQGWVMRDRPSSA